MGEAMIASLLSHNICKPADISVSDASGERRDYLKTQYGVAVTENNEEAAGGRTKPRRDRLPRHLMKQWRDRFKRNE